MTDLHTHILPGMDDGAKDPEESLALLRMEREQGIDTVVLTPHFYPENESAERFLRRRAAAFERLEATLEELPEEERASLPRLVLGAEVAWRPNLSRYDELPAFCIGETKNILLELPFTPWTQQMFHDIYDLMGKHGVLPVIAHLERYLSHQRSESVREVFELNVPIQISSDVFRHPMARRKAIKMLENNQVHFLASDCHNVTRRPPDMKAALQVAQHKFGEARVQEMIHFADGLVNT